jgi:YidC/Oxa1 family membrane protein insertase
MGMDRNTLIGFVLIGALLITMFVINSKERLSYEGEQKRIADSIAKVQKSKIDTAIVKKDNAKIDSLKKVASSGGIQSTEITEKFTTIENQVLKVTFSNKGGQPKSVELKQFKKYNQAPVVLNQSEFNKISYRVNSTPVKAEDIENIYFKTLPMVIRADNSKEISFEAGDTLGRKIIHQFV